MDMDKEGSTLKNVRGSNWIKILGQEKHTSKGSKLMNLIDCIWYVYIHVLACISFKFDMHACVVYASYRIWLMKWKLACIGW
jgi:hypothetical protein